MNDKSAFTSPYLTGNNVGVQDEKLDGLGEDLPGFLRGECRGCTFSFTFLMIHLCCTRFVVSPFCREYVIACMAKLSDCYCEDGDCERYPNQGNCNAVAREEGAVFPGCGCNYWKDNDTHR